MWTDDDVFIHPSSILYHNKPPDFVVYQELHRTSKVWMKGKGNFNHVLGKEDAYVTGDFLGVTVVESSWLSNLGKSLCTFSKPVELKVSKYVS